MSGENTNLVDNLRYCHRCGEDYYPSIGCDCHELERQRSVKQLSKMMREEFQEAKSYAHKRRTVQSIPHSTA